MSTRTEYRDRLIETIADRDRLQAEVAELREALTRGADLCERGHGHEWATEARALLEARK